MPRRNRCREDGCRETGTMRPRYKDLSDASIIALEADVFDDHGISTLI